MSTKIPPNETPPDRSRRAFLGAAAGGAALALLAPAGARGRDNPGPALLRDYVGRLCYNENPLGPSPLAATAIVDSASLAHRYPDWFADSLRSDLASLHGVGVGQTIAGCGATEILRLCALAFADPAGNVVCPYPSYGQFPSDADFLGAPYYLGTATLRNIRNLGIISRYDNPAYRLSSARVFDGIFYQWPASKESYILARNSF